MLFWPFTFLFIGLIKLICTLLGLIVIPIALLAGAYAPRPSQINPKNIVLSWTWKWMYIWGNEEDGIRASDTYANGSDFWRIYYWSALRNVANNLRYIPLLSPIPRSEKVDFVLFKDGKRFTKESGLSYKQLYRYEEYGPLLYVAWQGWYANIRWQFRVFGKLYRVWIGTKVYPSSVHKIPEYQKHGIGTTMQIKAVSKLEMSPERFEENKD